MSAPINARDLKISASAAAPKSVVDAIERDFFEVDKAVSVASELENERMGSAAQGIVIGATISATLWALVGAAIYSVVN